jgi:transposase
MNMPRRLGAEFFGTFWLTFAGCGSAVLAAILARRRLRRRPVPGRPRKIASLDTTRLTDVLLSPASQYGFETDFWTTRRLIQVVRAQFGVTISKQTMMRRLHEAGMTYQKPEREYFELSEEERQEWRRSELPRIREAVRQNRAILYFQDEANVSLTALLGKTWAPRGKTPKQRVTGKRGGVSAMSASRSAPWGLSSRAFW